MTLLAPPPPYTPPPPLHPPISLTYQKASLKFVFTVFVASLWCFEYVWVERHWDAQRRFRHFEKHYAYFLGFGIPLTLGTYFMGMADNLAWFNALCVG
jgi:hypothetical protein